MAKQQMSGGVQDFGAPAAFGAERAALGAEFGDARTGRTDPVASAISRRGRLPRSGEARPADADMAVLAVSLAFATSVGILLWKALAGARREQRLLDDGHHRERAARMQV
jgi:hypothetical protein